jgi:SAM-dependent methyltransferase
LTDHHYVDVPTPFASTSDSHDSYALSNDAPTAGQILNYLSQILDDHTMSVIDGVLDTSVPGRRCLELGAGNGSIAGRLAQRVCANRGEVIAVDIKPQHVQMPSSVTVLARDVTRDDLPAGPFDLVHARLLLSHLPQRREILRRCADVLAPGGALVIEEWGDSGARVLVDPRGEAADLYQHYNHTLLDVFEDHDHHLGWCAEVPTAMRDAGLIPVNTTVHARSWAGGTAGCQLPTVVSIELHDQLVAYGMTDSDLRRLRELLADPDLLLLSNPTWSTTGRRP